MNIWWIVVSLALKTLLFRSFHITQTQHNQISCKNERLARKPLEEWINWTRWSYKESGSADDIPIQDLTMLHKGVKTGQERNKWCAVSNPPHSVTQKCESWEMMLHITKLSLVGNLLHISLQAKTDTFKGTCLCQMKSEVTSTPWQSWLMRIIRSPHRVTIS